MSVEENTVNESKTETAKAEPFSTRNSYAVALDAIKEREQGEREAKEAPEKEVAPAAPVAEPIASSPAYEPPAEWDKAEKEDFKAQSPKQQEATLRLHKSRNSALESIKAEKAELEWAREIAREVTPFLKVRGDKEPAHSQVLKALKLVNELDSDTRQGVVNILKAKGLAVPKELEVQPAAENNSVPPHLQQKIDSIESRLAREDQAKVNSVMNKLWQDFESTKNAAGSNKYPSITNSDEGLRLASNIGSLVSGQTELSKQFIARTMARIPNCSPQQLFEAAYVWEGGKVDDSVAARTQDTQKHVQKSSRAASSVPGRGGQSSSGNEKKFATRREALAHAIQEYRERTGH